MIGSTIFRSEFYFVTIGLQIIKRLIFALSFADIFKFENAALLGKKKAVGD